MLGLPPVPSLPPMPRAAAVIYLADPDVTIHQGDALDVLAAMPDGSVHCCVTSPPYWGLRDYGTGAWEGGDEGCDHAKPTTTYNHGFNERWGQGGGQLKQEKKSEGQYAQECPKCGARRVDQQLGLEATPDEYVARMVEVFREVRRVLRADGTLWLNIGDSYAQGPSGSPGPTGLEGRSQDSTRVHVSKLGNGLKQKDLVGIPWRLAFALQADGWYLRSDIIWAKPNPMPESVTDRPTKAHEYVFLLSKSPRYFFDADAIREPHKEPWRGQGEAEKNNWSVNGERGSHDTVRQYNPAGRNVRSVWEIEQTGRERGGTKHTLIEDYFNDIYTEEQAYWLGFLYADGYLGRRHVDLQLAAKDAGHVERFQRALGSSREVTISRDGRARFIASSLRMANDLGHLGMRERSTMPILNGELTRHFVRGVFDGDGSAWSYLPAGRTKRRYGAAFLGSQGLLDEIREELGLRGKPKFSRGIHRLSVAAGDDIARLYAYLYDGATVWLERKRVEFPQAQSIAPATWSIATQPYPEAHFATFPEELVRRCVLAGCPEFVCSECYTPCVNAEATESDSVQAALQRMRPVLRGSGKDVLQPVLSDDCGKPSAREEAAPAVPELWEARQDDEAQDLFDQVRRPVGNQDGGESSPIPARAPSGELEGRQGDRRERLRAGLQSPEASIPARTPSGDGAEARAVADAGRVRPSSQRDQDGQPARELGADDAESASGNGGVSPLRRAVRDSLSPCCGAPLSPGIVLDPFIGSGTTGLVARKHGRHAIGIELNADYCELASRRLAQQSLLTELA